MRYNGVKCDVCGKKTEETKGGVTLSGRTHGGHSATNDIDICEECINSERPLVIQISKANKYITILHVDQLALLSAERCACAHFNGCITKKVPFCQCDCKAARRSDCLVHPNVILPQHREPEKP